MWTAILIGTLLASVTVVIHATGTTLWLLRLDAGDRATPSVDQGTAWNLLKLLIQTAIVVLLLHILEVTVWASVFHLLPRTPELGDFDDALYFSIVTFTTLGYGDIVLSQPWRLLGGIEAMVGIIHFGWSTALMFSIFQRLLRVHIQALTQSEPPESH
jgi:Ion channel